MTADWLLLHGAPLTPAMWDAVAALLPGAAVAPSTAPRDGDGCVTDIADRVAAGLAGRPHRVVGHSFGGQVALVLASRRPDLVAELTLMCTRHTPFAPFLAAAEAVAAGDVDVAATLRRWFADAEITAAGAAVRATGDMLRRADRRSWAAALRLIAAFDHAAQVPTIRCPATVIAAAHDPVADVAAMTDLHRRLPSSRLVLLPDAHHMSVFADPDRLAELLAG